MANTDSQIYVQTVFAVQGRQALVAQDGSRIRLAPCRSCGASVSPYVVSYNFCDVAKEKGP